MNSFPDSAGHARRAWLRVAQHLPAQDTLHEVSADQSDFAKSPVWRGVFIAAAIVIVMNCLPDSIALQPAARVHATV